MTFPATGTWSLVAGTGNVVNVNDPASAVSGLTIGENVFVWTVSNGPCLNGLTTDTVSIFLFDENNASADAGPDQELCVPTDSTFMAGNTPIFPASGTWTVIAGTGVFPDPTDPGALVNNLSIGVNTFRWTTSNGPCANSITSMSST